MSEKDPVKIQDYAIIGDCRGAALIRRGGSLDWLCWPRFDSPAILAGLLDRDRGGHWQIAPCPPGRIERRYVGNSNVLETLFDTPGGTAVLIDLMPVASEEYKRRTTLPDHEILRQIECARGEVQIAVDFQPRSGYGLSPVKIRSAGKLGLRMEVGRGVYWLRGTHPVNTARDALRAEFRLRAGERAQFSLSYTEDAPAVLPCLGEKAAERIRTSQQWWQQWAARAKYEGRYPEAVIRSALILKLLTYAPSGAVIAAATSSLPERIGAGLNWDYRYCWLRDASLTVRALIGLGYWEEAHAFLSWMLHATRLTQPELHIVYTVFGETAPQERELHHLRGFLDSRPVRIGNEARSQLQLDVYGEVVDAAAQFAFHGHRFDRITQRALVNIGKFVVANWRRADEGIWEPRSGRQHHTHSRLLCWAALDRLEKLASEGLLEHAPAQQFAEEREAIRKNIRDQGWNSDLRSYVSTLGGNELDASLLLLSWYGFESAGCERMQRTYSAIDAALRAGPGLLYRYQREPAEGAFGICSFWEAEYLALGGGSVQDSRVKFEQLLRYANDLGLYAEEVDPGSGDALGNYPQAFTHVGLINAALSLHEREQGVQQLAHRKQSAGPAIAEQASDKYA